MHYTPGVGAVSHRITGWLSRPGQDRGPHVQDVPFSTSTKTKSSIFRKKKSFRSGPSSAAFSTAASPNCTRMVGITMRRIPQGGRPARCTRSRCSGRERPINETTLLYGVDNYKHSRVLLVEQLTLNTGTCSQGITAFPNIINLILPIAVPILTNQLATSVPCRRAARAGEVVLRLSDLTDLQQQ